jgi:chromatin remodeling complex protein RSC6
VINVKYATRREAMKLIWEYIRANGLVGDRQRIVCDEKLGVWRPHRHRVMKR